MEFNFDTTAEEAMAQINSKDYSLPFIIENHKVINIGKNFNRETRNIDNWIVS